MNYQTAKKILAFFDAKPIRPALTAYMAFSLLVATVTSGYLVHVLPAGHHFFDVFFTWSYGALTFLGMMAFPMVGCIWAMFVVDAYDTKHAVHKPQTSMGNVDNDPTVSHGKLVLACTRLSKFLQTVDYRQNNIPIGIRFEGPPTNGKCAIQWSRTPILDFIPIGQAADRLDEILDELELQYAIKVDEDTIWSSP